MSKQDLSLVLAHLAEIAPGINRADAEATAAIRAVEGFLRGLNMGINGWHSYETETQSKGVEIRRGLVYAHVKGGFRIGVQAVWHHVAKGEYAVSELGHKAEEVIPWDDCARDIRIRAFAALHDMLIDLLKRAERTLDETKATAKTVSKVLAATGAGEARPKKKALRQEEKPLQTREGVAGGSERQSPQSKNAGYPKHKK